MADEQERRTERLTLAVTPSEKKAAEFVALARDTDGVSGLLRELSLTDVLAEHRRMRAAIDGEKGRAA